MNSLLEKALKQPERPTRSTLEPHYEAIAILRKKNWTFKEIAQFFKEEGIEISAAGVFQFWTRRNKPKTSRPKKSLDVNPAVPSKFKIWNDDETTSPKPTPPAPPPKKKFVFNSFEEDGF